MSRQQSLQVTAAQPAQEFASRFESTQGCEVEQPLSETDQAQDVQDPKVQDACRAVDQWLETPSPPARNPGAQRDSSTFRAPKI